MIWKATAVLCLGLAVLGYKKQPDKVSQSQDETSAIGYHKSEHHDEYASSNPSYEFLYKIKNPHTHDSKGQHETNKDGKIKGEYWMMEPDGRKHTVSYYVDKNNHYKAVVRYKTPHLHFYFNTKKYGDIEPAKDLDSNMEGQDNESDSDERRLGSGEDSSKDGQQDDEGRGQDQSQGGDEGSGQDENQGGNENRGQSEAQDENRGQGQSEAQGGNESHRRGECRYRNRGQGKNEGPGSTEDGGRNEGQGDDDGGSQSDNEDRGQGEGVDMNRGQGQNEFERVNEGLSENENQDSNEGRGQDERQSEEGEGVQTEGGSQEEGQERQGARPAYPTVLQDNKPYIYKPMSYQHTVYHKYNPRINKNKGQH